MTHFLSVFRVVGECKSYKSGFLLTQKSRKGVKGHVETYLFYLIKDFQVANIKMVNVSKTEYIFVESNKRNIIVSWTLTD